MPTQQQEAPRRSRRARLRSTPGFREAYRVGVFLLGLACIAIGLALAVLPGPLTIPPVLLGLWIWSTEFAFAHKLFEQFQEKDHDAWAHAKRKPRSSAAITIAGLIGAGVAVWAVQHYALVDRARDVVGI